MHQLTEQQRSSITSDLERSTAAILESARGLTPAQWAWKPAPEVWSIAETLEHVALVERLFQGRLERMAAAAASDEAAQRVAGREQLATAAGRSRETKRNAPPPALPQGAFATFEAFEAHFLPLRGQSLAFVRETQAGLHGVVEAHPALGELSGYQWLCLLAAHTDRHAEQAREVRAAPGFPPSDVPS